MPHCPREPHPAVPEHRQPTALLRQSLAAHARQMPTFPANSLWWEYVPLLDLTNYAAPLRLAELKHGRDTCP